MRCRATKLHIIPELGGAWVAEVAMKPYCDALTPAVDPSHRSALQDDELLAPRVRWARRPCTRAQTRRMATTPCPPPRKPLPPPTSAQAPTARSSFASPHLTPTSPPHLTLGFSTSRPVESCHRAVVADERFEGSPAAASQ